MYRHLSRFRLRRTDLTGIPLLVAIGISLHFLEGGMARVEEAPILEARVSKVMDADRYGRLVARCILPNGQDIAAEMIRSGAAAEYCRYSDGYYGTC